MWTCCDVLMCVCLYLAQASCALLDHGEMKFFDEPMSFTVESTILLNDIQRRDKEVSYKLNSTLEVMPLGADAGGQLVRFTVLYPHLLGRGTHVNAEYVPLASTWDAHTSSDFYARDNQGTFSEIYVNPDEPSDLIDFKRSLLSLFQFRYSADVGNETDFSGSCEVQYELMSDQVIRKVKRRCSGEEGGGAVSRRVARYSLDARGPQEVYAEEVHELHAAIKARAWLRLRRAYSPAPAHAPSTVPLTHRLLPVAASVEGNLHDESPSVEELEALLAEAGELTGAGPGGLMGSGGAHIAEAALRLLPAVRAAALPELTVLLDRAAAASDRTLEEACSMLGAAGTAAALAAVRTRLATPHLARRYYEGLALAEHPDESVVLEALHVGEAGAGDAAPSALMAAGAAGTRLSPSAASAVRVRLLRALDLCKEEECTAQRLRALGNMRHADDTELLLRHAGGGGAAATRAALGALAVGPVHALYNITRLRRLQRIVLGPGASGERAAALELLLARGSRASASLQPLLLSLFERAPPELRQLAWGRLATLAERDAGLRALVVALQSRDGGWVARAQSGHSAAVERDAGGGGGWRAALRSSLLEHTGAMCRAELTLTARARDGDMHDVVTLELRSAESTAEPELLLTVGGVLLQPRRLRDNRTAVSVQQLTRDDRDARPLLGGGMLRMRRLATRAVALQTDEAGELAARWAQAAQVDVHVAGAWGELSASSLSWVALRVRMLLVLGGCARADVDPLVVGSEVRLRSELGAARRRVRRVRGALWPVPGRMLPLADLLRAECRIKD